MMLQVLGEIHRGHAARTDLFLDGVAVCEGGFEAVEKIWHRRLRWSAGWPSARSGSSLSNHFMKGRSSYLNATTMNSPTIRSYAPQNGGNHGPALAPMRCGWWKKSQTP